MARKAGSGQSANRTTIRDFLQTRAQGQKRTELVREEMDRLDVPPELTSDCGALARDTDFGFDEEAAGDDQMQEDPDVVDVALASEAEAPEQPAPLRRAAIALSDVIGSRPPVVLFRLREAAGEIRAELCLKPSAENAEALEELRALVEECFRQGLPLLTAEERAQLLGTVPTNVARRLALLLRLAVKGGDKVVAEDGKSRLQYTPNDRGLERYAGKFVALPDGTPFSLRLLLLDLRGRKAEDNFFDQLPLVIKLLALRRALDSEERERRAATDYEFGARMQHALEGLLGDPNVPRPTEDQVRRRLRDNLKRNGVGHLFPKKEDRQRHYDQMPATSSAGSEASQ